VARAGVDDLPFVAPALERRVMSRCLGIDQRKLALGVSPDARARGCLDGDREASRMANDEPGHGL